MYFHRWSRNEVGRLKSQEKFIRKPKNKPSPNDHWGSVYIPWIDHMFTEQNTPNSGWLGFVGTCNPLHSTTIFYNRWIDPDSADPIAGGTPWCFQWCEHDSSKHPHKRVWCVVNCSCLELVLFLKGPWDHGLPRSGLKLPHLSHERHALGLPGQMGWENTTVEVDGGQHAYHMGMNH